MKGYLQTFAQCHRWTPCLYCARNAREHGDLDSDNNQPRNAQGLNQSVFSTLEVTDVVEKLRAELCVSMGSLSDLSYKRSCMFSSHWSSPKTRHKGAKDNGIVERCWTRLALMGLAACPRYQ